MAGFGWTECEQALPWLHVKPAKPETAGEYLFGEEAEENMKQTREVSFALRYRLLAVAWAVTILAAMFIVFPGLRLMLWLPAGVPLALERLFGPAVWLDWLFRSGDSMVVSPVLLLYVALTAFGLLLKRRSFYFGVYGVLCVLLVLSIFGLYQVAHWRM